jgi:hypothetical protein
MVALEVAKKDVDKWLEYKKISDTKKESYADNISTLVNAVADGALIVNEDFTLKHELKFPLENEIKTTSLEYKPRLQMKQIHQHTQGIKSNDIDGRIAAYIAALSGKPKAVVVSLDSEDYAIAQAVAVFFI